MNSKFHNLDVLKMKIDRTERSCALQSGQQKVELGGGDNYICKFTRTKMVKVSLVKAQVRKGTFMSWGWNFCEETESNCLALTRIGEVDNYW